METNKNKWLAMLEHLPPCSGEEFQAADEKVCVVVRFEDRDRLGCLVREVIVTGPDGTPRMVDPVRAAETITYLGEPLVLLERDDPGRTAVLRSLPPRTTDEAIGYFELWTSPDRGTRLERFEYNRQTGERQAVPAAMTMDTLARLVDDLSRLIL